MIPRAKLVNPSSSPVTIKHMDWKKCVLCQEVTDFKLVDPMKITNKENEFEGYRSLEAILSGLNAEGQLSSLPFEINIKNIDDGSGIFNTLLRNHAKYHKSCKSERSNRRLSRAEMYL